MSDEDIALDEKRVFEGRRGASLAYVASDLGLARVEVSDDQIGRFGLVHRDPARDVAVDTREGTIAIATDGGALLGSDDEFAGTGFGSAVAVAFAGAPVAASPDGGISRYEERAWTSLGTLDAPVSAMDGDLVATTEGVYRIVDDEMVHLGSRNSGVADVRDVASGGAFAATAAGVYRWTGDDWIISHEGNARAVASSDHHTVAVVDGVVHERTADGWRPTDCPNRTVVDVAAGRATYAITDGGTLLVDPPAAKDGAEGWASRSLGVTDVAALAVLDGVG